MHVNIVFISHMLVVSMVIIKVRGTSSQTLSDVSAQLLDETFFIGTFTCVFISSSHLSDVRIISW